MASAYRVIPTDRTTWLSLQSLTRGDKDEEDGEIPWHETCYKLQRRRKSLTPAPT